MFPFFLCVLRVIVRLFSKLCPSLWQMPFTRLKKKMFYWGLLQLCPSVDSVFALTGNHKGFTGMFLLGSFFLHPPPTFCWPELGLPLQTICTHSSLLNQNECHLLFACLCYLVLRGVPLSPCQHAGLYKSGCFQPGLLRENNSVSCWDDFFAWNQRKHVKAMESFLILSLGTMILGLLGLYPAWVLIVHSERGC